MSIRVLHVVSELGSGGVERMLLNYRLMLNETDIRFDFVVHGNNEGELEREFAARGARIFHVTPKHVSLVRNVREILGALRAERYDVVHAHQNLSNFVPLSLARLCGIKVRISHGHGYPRVSKLAAYVLKRLTRFVANYYAACTDDVGQWLHGTRWRDPGAHSLLMRNAINPDAFEFDLAQRTDVRAALGVGGDTLVILQLGRLSQEKNHEFSLDLVRRLSERGCNALLVIVGSGPREKRIRDQIQTGGLAESVRIIGFRDDIGALLNGADVLIMPSISEGLGLVAVEAQASGLPVVASTGVPLDVKFTELISYLSLSDLDAWDRTVSGIVVGGPRMTRGNELARHGYAVAIEAPRYARFIESIVQSARLGWID